jgi:hypothetical protein
MPSLYLRNYLEEYRRVGDVVFKQRHRTPFLVVAGRVAELADDLSGRERTMPATRKSHLVAETALLERVFPVAKAAHAPRGPIVLGRSGDADVAIPEYSISKRHCFFDFDAGGVKLVDCGSTNGTFVDERPLEVKTPTPIRNGARIALGRFAFVFYTAVGFHTYVKSLAD